MGFKNKRSQAMLGKRNAKKLKPDVDADALSSAAAILSPDV